MKTRVVHSNKEPYDVYIGRPSIWGNPFRLGEDGDRDEIIDKYHRWLLTQDLLLLQLWELRGKRLGCWCKPKSCHGDILAMLADGPRGDPAPFGPSPRSWQ